MDDIYRKLLNHTCVKSKKNKTQTSMQRYQFVQCHAFISEKILSATMPVCVSESKYGTLSNFSGYKNRTKDKSISMSKR